MSQRDECFESIRNFGLSVWAVFQNVLSLVAAAIAFLGIVAITVLILAVAAGIAFLTYFALVNQAALITSIDNGIRCGALPVWESIIEPVYQRIQRGYNYGICWFDLVGWYVPALGTNVLLPILLDCDIRPMIINLVAFLDTLGRDLILDWVFSGDFLSQPIDAEQICLDYGALATSAQDIICCVCSDLCTFLRVQPISLAPGIPYRLPILRNIPLIGQVPMLFPIPTFPFLNPLAVISNQLADPAFCGYVFHMFNAFFSAFQVLWRLIVQILLVVFGASITIDRPDFTVAFDQYCSASEDFFLSYENIYTDILAEFIPVPIISAKGLLVWAASLQCIAANAVDAALKMLTNIDLIVAYPTSTYWYDSMRLDIAEVLNLIGPVNKPGFILLTSDPTSSIYQKNRLTDGVCFIIRWVLCDPAYATSVCALNFGVDATILGGFSFDFICCALEAAVSAILDVLCGLIEMTYFFTSTDDFFTFVDVNAFETLDVVKQDLVNIVGCVTQPLSLVPVVGPCLQDLFELYYEVLLCLAVFLFKVVVSIFTLPFFLAVLSVPKDNFLSDGTRALEEWEGILNLISGDPDNPSARSIANCLCVVLNVALEFPPLPCTGDCVPTGYILDKKRASPELMELVKDRLKDAQPISSEEPDSYHVAGKQDRGPFISGVKSWARYYDEDHLRNHPDRFYNASIRQPERIPGTRDEDGVPYLHFFERSLRQFAFATEGSILAAQGLHDSAAVDKLLDSYYERIELGKGRRPYVRRGLFNDQTNTSFSEWLDDPIGKSAPRGVTHVERVGGNTIVCNDPMNLPDCYDVCCAVRTSLDLVTTILRVFARFIQNIARGNPDWDYFRDRIFEADLKLVIDKVIAPLQCVCDFVELLFPIPNLDLCAPFLTLGELIKGTLEIFLNAIFSLALGRDPDAPIFNTCSVEADCTTTGYKCCASFDPDTGSCVGENPGGMSGTCTSPPYPYFTTGGFMDDINTLIDLTIEIVEELCCIFQAVLPIPGFNVCCFQQQVLILALEILRWLLQIIVSLSTIRTTGKLFWQAPALEDVGFLVQGKVVSEAIFGMPGGTCGEGSGGIILCICGLIDTVLPARPCPGLPIGTDECPTDSTNCPYVDFCCIIRRISFLGRELLDFALELLVATWQPWVDNKPVVFIAYFFCDPEAPPASSLYSPSCANIENITNEIFALVSECPCEFLQYIDALLPGGDCFCGVRSGATSSAPGMFRAIPALVEVILLKLIQLIRGFWSSDYWNPGTHGEVIPECQGRTTCSWALFFFGKIADTSCTAFASVFCLLTVLFPRMDACSAYRDSFFGGIPRWAFEAIIRVIELIEGIVETISSGGNCSQYATDPVDGSITATVESGCLAAALGALLSFPFDLLLADPYLDISGCSCTGVADPAYLNGVCPNCVYSSTCACDVTRIPFCGGPLDPNLDPSLQPTPLRVQGILTGFLRFLSCMAGVAGAGGLGRAIGALVAFLSIIWQLTTKLIGIFISFLNFIVALISVGGDDNCECLDNQPTDYGLGWVQGTDFGAGLCYPRCPTKGTPFFCRTRCVGGALCIQPRSPKPLCGFLGLIQAFFETVKGIFTLFVPPPQVPTLPPSFKRGVPAWLNATMPLGDTTSASSKESLLRFVPSSRKEFSERVAKYRTIRATDPNATTDGVSLLLAAFTDFDVTDCLADEESDGGAGLIHCVCRNFGDHFPQHICTYDNATGEGIPTSDNITTIEITTAMGEMFSGASICADLVRRCEHMAWKDIDYTERFEYVSCLSKHVQGHRLHEFYEPFPADFFHRPDGLLALISNTGEDLKRRAREAARYSPREVQTRSMMAAERGARMKKDKERAAITRRTLSQRFHNRDIVEQAIRMDRVETRLFSDAFREQSARAWDNVLQGKVRPSLLGATKSYVHAWADLFGFAWRINYLGGFFTVGDAVSGIMGDISAVSGHVMRHQWDSLSVPWKTYKETWWNATLERQEQTRAARDDGSPVTWSDVSAYYYNGPFYKWWTGPAETTRNPLRPFLDHVNRVYFSPPDNITRVTTERASFDWRPPLRTRVRGDVQKKIAVIKEAVTHKYRVKWTPKIAHNWDKTKRPLLKVWRHMAPANFEVNVPVHIQEDRALFNCDCRFIDDAVELLGDLTDYCLNEFVVNIPEDTKFTSSVQNYLESTSRYRNGSWYLPKHEYNTTHDLIWKRHTEGDEMSFVRPRYQKKEESTVMQQFKRYKRAQFRRSVSVGRDFNLLLWVTCSFFELISVGGDYLGKANGFVQDAIEWVSNTNIDPAGCPDDVGLLYWALMPFRCLFVESNNCQSGCAFGIVPTLKYAVLAFALGFVYVVIGLPGAALIAALIFNPLAWLIVIPMVAWHYPPFCYLRRFPFITLPHCLMDEVAFLINSIINETPLQGFFDCDPETRICLLPKCMVRNDDYPVCPEQLDVVDCVEIGMADGIQNSVYLIYWLAPNACDWFMENILSWCTPGMCIIPEEAVNYISDSFMDFKAGTPNMQCQWNTCFYYSIGSMVLLAVLAGLALVLAGYFLLPVFKTVISVVYTTLALPVVSVFISSVTSPGVGSTDVDDEEEDGPDEEEDGDNDDGAFDDGQGDDNSNADLVGEEISLFGIRQRQDGSYNVRVTARTAHMLAREMNRQARAQAASVRNPGQTRVVERHPPAHQPSYSTRILAAPVRAARYVWGSGADDAAEKKKK